MKGLELSQNYYLEYGVSLIRDRFAGYEERIAVGLVGSGSECYGFDDDISTDHDFGPSFCMWLTDQDHERIGDALNEAYKELPDAFMGIRRIGSVHGGGRTGVLRTGDFYRKYTGKPDGALTLNDWLTIPEHYLAEATNGKVFRDDLGEFSGVRSLLLNYYPEDVRIKKIAARAAFMAQSGQYNYSRSMRRSETVAARLALDEFIRNAISMIYLLNKKFQPFYKWAFKGTEDLPVLAETRKMIEQLVLLPVRMDDWSQENELIEAICGSTIAELKRQGLTDFNDTFLDNHTTSIMSRIGNDKIRALHVMAG
jgi:hypothetical protein